MNAKLTQDELQAIKERAEKATGGYWFADSHEWPGNGNLRYWTSSCELMGDGLCASVTKEDAEFIAASRQDIPKLMAEIERLRKALEYYANPYIYKFEVNNAPWWTEVIEAEVDNGHIAREALK